MGKPKPKTKSAPKKKVALEDILKEIKGIYRRVDKLEGDISAIRGAMHTHTPQPPEKKEGMEQETESLNK